MQKSMLAFAVATIALLFVSAFTQERTKPKAPSTVAELLTRAGTSFGEAHYVACLADIREATALVTAERVKWIRAAFPAAPTGMEKLPPDEAAAAMAAFASTMGTMVGQDYSGGEKSITMMVTVDSPVVQMMGMMMSNPEMLEKGSEIIKYGTYKGVLKDQGSGSLELQIMIDKTMVQIDSSGLTDEALLEFMNQKAVDALVAALAK